VQLGEAESDPPRRSNRIVSYTLTCRHFAKPRPRLSRLFSAVLACQSSVSKVAGLHPAGREEPSYLPPVTAEAPGYCPCRWQIIWWGWVYRSHCNPHLSPSGGWVHPLLCRGTVYPNPRSQLYLSRGSIEAGTTPLTSSTVLSIFSCGDTAPRHVPPICWFSRKRSLTLVLITPLRWLSHSSFPNP